MWLTCEFSEERGTWNVFSEDGEWIFEGTMEQCFEMVNRNNAAMYEEVI